jgi:hypothetical protein
MDDQRRGMHDWEIPAVLVALGLGLLFVAGLAFAVSYERRVDTPALLVDLDRYTECLIDHGADVPRVKVRRDGGFEVIVPGSLLAGDADPKSWAPAVEACAERAPDLFGGLVGALVGGWRNGVPGELFDEIERLEAHQGNRRSAGFRWRSVGVDAVSRL